MSTANTNQPRLLSTLRAIRQLAEDRNDAERLKEVADALRRIALSAARIKSLQVMRFGSDALAQAATLIDGTKEALPPEAVNLVAQASQLTAASERIKILEAAACTELSERVRTYAELCRKFSLQANVSDLKQCVQDFTDRQVHRGPVGPQLEEVRILAARMAALYYDVTSTVLGYFQASFGPNVDVHAIRELMGEGLLVTTLKPPQLKRLLSSKLSQSLVIRLK